MSEENNVNPEPETTSPETETTTTEPKAEEPSSTLLGEAGARDEPSKEEPSSESEEPSEGEESPSASTEEWEPDALEVPDEWKSDEAFQTFAKEAKELGLPKDGAQKMLDLYKQVREKEWKTFVETRTKWAEEAKQALGEDAPEKLATIGRALGDLDPKVEQQFREIMNATGVGDHPAVVQVMHELAKRAVGGSFAQGQPAGADKKKPGIRDVFYPKHEE